MRSPGGQLFGLLHSVAQAPAPTGMALLFPPKLQIGTKQSGGLLVAEELQNTLAKLRLALREKTGSAHMSRLLVTC